MGGSQKPGPTTRPAGAYNVPARTPGPTGVNDHGDPNITTRLGDTPGPVGVKDHADPTLPKLTSHDAGPVSKTQGGTAVAVGLDHNPTNPGTYLWLQEEGESKGKWIRIESFQWDNSRATSTVSPTGGSGTRERVLPREMNFTALLDADTQRLINLEKTGKLLSGKVVNIARDGTFSLGIEFSGALVTQFAYSGLSRLDEPIVSFGLNFETWKVLLPESGDQPAAYDLGAP
ncbi:MAG: type VI secretion system tube protein Hcp [Terriglobales bacterium]